MNVDGKDYKEGIGWYDINETFCINGCKKPTVGESQMVFLPVGDDDFNAVTELLCIDCITDTRKLPL